MRWIQVRNAERLKKKQVRTSINRSGGGDGGGRGSGQAKHALSIDPRTILSSRGLEKFGNEDEDYCCPRTWSTYLRCVFCVCSCGCVSVYGSTAGQMINWAGKRKPARRHDNQHGANQHDGGESHDGHILRTCLRLEIPALGLQP